PPGNSKQIVTSGIFSHKFEIKEAVMLNEQLILLANRTFGEGKWNHTVTNQTIDFIEAFMGKYVCGCVTFVKIQLQDGTFHEDIGYCHAEGAMKGLSIHCARIGSLADAFKKVLLCFDNKLGCEIQKLSQRLSDSYTTNLQKEDFQCSFPDLQTEILEPCAQSTPFLSHKNDEQKEKSDNIVKLKSLNDEKRQIIAQQQVARSKSPTEQKEQYIPSKTSSDLKNHLQSNSTNHQKQQNNVQKEQDSIQVLNEEEFLRMERKRKQMEKQAEYKRLMKEKEHQKFYDNKKLNPKY
ncbi:DNA repair protein RAD52 like protein, partial [Habropoda laboriosa]